MNYQLDFTPVIEGFPSLLWSCLGTLGLVLAGMAIAIVIGIGGVILRDSPITFVRRLTMAFVEPIRNTPFLVQVYFIFLALPLPGIKINPTPTAIIAPGVNGGADLVSFPAGVEGVPLAAG